MRAQHGLCYHLIHKNHHGLLKGLANKSLIEPFTIRYLTFKSIGIRHCGKYRLVIVYKRSYNEIFLYLVGCSTSFKRFSSKKKH